jgi:hypothetical protein
MEYSNRIQAALEQLTLNPDTMLEDNIGYVLPRIQKSNVHAKELALQLFPVNVDTDDEEYVKLKNWSYIKYGKLLSKLRNAYNRYEQHLKEQKESELKEQKKCKSCAANKEIFHQLYNNPSSEFIINPTAMPVDVAPLEDLQPFFEYMKLNTSVQPEINGRFHKYVNGAGYKEFKRGVYYTDGRIDMCKQVVGTPYIANLMESIKNNSHVRHFLLGNNVVGDKGAYDIANFIRTYKPNIETWYLAGNAFTEDGIKEIADALSNDTFANALWLKRNPLTSNGAKYIANMLTINKHLTTLDLQNTYCRDEGVKYIFEALRENNTLNLLYLDANDITEIGVGYIADYFNYLADTNRVGLQYLWLSMNKIKDDGIKVLSGALKRYGKMISLCVASNRIGPDGCKQLLEDLEDSNLLTTLDCGHYKATYDIGELPNNFGNESTPYIKKFLEYNKSVQYFSILNNYIDLEYLYQIVASLERNNNICMFVYGQSHLQVSTDKILNEKIKKIMDNNSIRLYGCGAEEFRKNYARQLKHTKLVFNIDSVYRNNM